MGRNLDKNLDENKLLNGEEWMRLHRKIQYLEMLLLGILILCLFSLVLNAVNFYLFSRG